MQVTLEPGDVLVLPPLDAVLPPLPEVGKFVADAGGPFQKGYYVAVAVGRRPRGDAAGGDTAGGSAIVGEQLGPRASPPGDVDRDVWVRGDEMVHEVRGVSAQEASRLCRDVLGIQKLASVDPSRGGRRGGRDRRPGRGPRESCDRGAVDSVERIANVVRVVVIPERIPRRGSEPPRLRRPRRLLLRGRRRRRGRRPPRWRWRLSRTGKQEGTPSPLIGSQNSFFE